MPEARPEPRLQEVVERRSQLARREERFGLMARARMAEEADHPVLEEDPVLRAFIEGCQAEPAAVAELPTYLERIKSSQLEARLSGLIKVRQLTHDPSIRSAIIDSGAVGLLIAICEHSDGSQLRFEALWIINSILMGSDIQVIAVVKKGFVRTAVKLLSCPQLQILESLIWCLGNIAADNQHDRDDILSLKGLTSIIEVFGKLPPKGKCIAIWTIKNICILKPQPRYRLVKAALPLLLQNLSIFPHSLELKDSLWATSCIVNAGKSSEVAPFFSGALVDRLKDVVCTRNEQVVKPAVRILGVLATSEGGRVGAGRLLPALLCGKAKTRKEACWLLSNLSASAACADDILRDEECAARLQEMLVSDAPEVRREVVFLLRNLALKAGEQLSRPFFTGRLLEALTDELRTASDSRHLVLLLEALDAAFKIRQLERVSPLLRRFVELGGGELVMRLQEHRSSLVYEAAFRFLETHFEESEPA